MEIDSGSLLYMQYGVGIAALLTCGLLIRKAVSFHGRIWLGIVVFVFSAILLTYFSVHLPLKFLGESDRVQHHLLVDIMMYGTGGLIIVGVIGFAIDHMHERPNMLMVAAAAALAVALLPFFYRFQRESLHRSYKITIIQPNTKLAEDLSAKADQISSVKNPD